MKRLRGRRHYQSKNSQATKAFRKKRKLSSKHNRANNDESDTTESDGDKEYSEEDLCCVCGGFWIPNEQLKEIQQISFDNAIESGKLPFMIIFRLC